jgi:TRAP transporter TAXI family solute receptor
MRKVIVLLIILAIAGLYYDPPVTTKSYVIATATPGGTFYPVGVAIGALISVKLHQSYNITATAITSAGSGENVHMLQSKEADFAILQALYGAMCYRGERQYENKPVKTLRSITVLWNNVEHFILLKKYSKTGNIKDLANLNRRFSIGKRGSGTEGSGRVILGALGIKPDIDFNSEYLGYNGSVQSIIDGRIVGANIPAGIPASSITQLYAQMGEEMIAILQFTEKQLTKIREIYPIWTKYSIPTETYPGQKNEISTIVQPNFLACHADLPEETVYHVTKTIYENLNYLQNIHQATRALKLESAITGLPVPLHPGAVKYYREQGLKIPEYLLFQ